MKWKQPSTVFEGVLWNSRLLVLAVGVASLTAALVRFYIATVDAYCSWRAASPLSGWRCT